MTRFKSKTAKSVIPVSIKDKILIGLNRLAVSNMKDKDRGRFMKKIYGTVKY